jgi:hypothetical protein
MHSLTAGEALEGLSADQTIPTKHQQFYGTV